MHHHVLTSIESSCRNCICTWIFCLVVYGRDCPFVFVYLQYISMHSVLQTYCTYNMQTLSLIDVPGLSVKATQRNPASPNSSKIKHDSRASSYGYAYIEGNCYTVVIKKQWYRLDARQTKRNAFIMISLSQSS